MTQDPIIMRPQLQRWLGRHSDTVRKWMRDKRLPQPDVAMSRESIGWKVSTLRAAGIMYPLPDDQASPPTPEASAGARP